MKSNPGIICSDRLTTTSDNRKQRTFLVNKQILCNPKRCVQPHNPNCHNQSYQDIGTHVRGHERNHRNQAQNAEHGSIVEGLVEYDEGSVAREVEEEPCDEDKQEDDHGERVPEEAEEEDEKGYHGVVESEVTQVSFRAGHGVGVWDGRGEGGEVEELAPWAGCGGERLGGCCGGGGVLGAGDEGEIGGWLGLRGGHGGGGDGAVTAGGFGGH